jgi:hypothetical protein
MLAERLRWLGKDNVGVARVPPKMEDIRDVAGPLGAVRIGDVVGFAVSQGRGVVAQIMEDKVRVLRELLARPIKSVRREDMVFVGASCGVLRRGHE